MAVAEVDGLVFACVLNGEGGAQTADWSKVEAWTPARGVLWAHLDLNAPRVRHWVSTESGLSATTAQAMLATETRPRVFHGKNGFVAILRGVNTNPGADPEDMVDLRMWSDGNRVLTIRRRKLLTPRDILAELLEAEAGPRDASELFERIITRLTERMAGVADGIDETLDGIENTLDRAPAGETRQHLADVRSTAVALRRFLAPQRDAMATLLTSPPKWLEDRARLNLRETTDRLQGYLEDLDAAREHALVLKDQVASAMDERMNRNMYLLSIVAAIFLPLSFGTGLLGMNVGGIPGVENGWAFMWSCLIFAAMLGLELLLFRWLKWL